MSMIDTLTVINRPEANPQTSASGWSLAARQIGEKVLWVPPLSVPGLPLEQRRQNAVFNALAEDMSDPESITDYARNIHHVTVTCPQDEVSAAQERYQAATGFKALSLAIRDGSVPIVRRPRLEVPASVKYGLNLLTSGTMPEAAAIASGIDPRDEQGIQGYLGRVCDTFGVKNLYAALRRAYEHGIVKRYVPIQPLGSGNNQSRVVAANQVGFTLAPRELNLTPRQLEVGRLHVAGLDEIAIGRECAIQPGTVKRYTAQLYRKLQAADTAEAFTKLIVFGLASPPSRDASDIAGIITAQELSVLSGVAQGLPNAYIGSELGVGVHTVKSHLKHVVGKTGVHGRAAAVVCMFQIGAFRVE